MKLPLQSLALHADWREELALTNRAITFCWAAWSPPDIQLSAVLAQVIPELKGCVFFTADLDDQTLWPLFAEAAVASNPCLLLRQDGEFIDRIIGYNDRKRLRELFRQWGVL